MTRLTVEQEFSSFQDHGSAGYLLRWLLGKGSVPGKHAMVRRSR